MKAHPPPVAAYAFTWLALLALVAATFGLAHVSMGPWNTVAALGIAAVKVLLVALFFMHLKRASAVVAIFALIGLVWLAILFGLSSTDYATRDMKPAPWEAPR